MTPAELKTLREACGLSLPQLATLGGVQERTARYWESGRSHVPADVARAITRLDASLTEAARQSAAAVASAARSQGSAPQEVVLLRYSTDADLARYRPDMRALPATTHAALIYRARALLESEGIACRIVYMRPADYEAWRLMLPDTEQTRAEWAALQHPDKQPGTSAAPA